MNRWQYCSIICLLYAIVGDVTDNKYVEVAADVYCCVFGVATFVFLFKEDKK